MKLKQVIKRKKTGKTTEDFLELDNNMKANEGRMKIEGDIVKNGTGRGDAKLNEWTEDKNGIREYYYEIVE